MTTATVSSSITTDGATWLLVPHPDEADPAWRAETLELFDAVARLDREDGRPSARSSTGRVPSRRCWSTARRSARRSAWSPRSWCPATGRCRSS